MYYIISLGTSKESDRWTAQDQADLANFSLQYAATLFPEDEEAIQ